MPRRRLPALGDPGSTLLRLENRTLMFLFGGYNGDEDHPSSDLIAIDIDRLIWWVVQVAGKVEGGNIAARIDPAMTAIGNKIYIFAGITAYDDNPEHLNSYSVAEYDLESRSWRWELADIPYTDVVPPNHIFGDCIPVYDGKKILLTPGRRKATDVSDYVTSYKFHQKLSISAFASRRTLCFISASNIKYFKQHMHQDISLVKCSGTMFGDLTTLRSLQHRIQTPFDLCDLQPLIILIAHQGIRVLLPAAPIVNSLHHLFSFAPGSGG